MELGINDINSPEDNIVDQFIEVNNTDNNQNSEKDQNSKKGTCNIL